MSADMLSKRVRAFYGCDRSSTHGEGTVIWYCEAPTYGIRREDGTVFDWRVDLTEPTYVPRHARTAP